VDEAGRPVYVGPPTSDEDGEDSIEDADIEDADIEDAGTDEG
jgi:hypothetical protein